MVKTCYIIAGPNGAGKTTFALDILPEKIACEHYINADLIAQGLSPFAPGKVALQAGKLMLREIEKKVAAQEPFAFESTLSGTSYISKIKLWKKLGYEIILYYFKLPSVDLAIKRVKERVKQGGHNIPEPDIRRRFERSWKNFNEHYKQIADVWIVFDTSGSQPVIIERSVI